MNKKAQIRRSVAQKQLKHPRSKNTACRQTLVRLFHNLFLAQQAEGPSRPPTSARAVRLGCTSPSRTALLHKVTFGLLGEEKIVEEATAVAASRHAFCRAIALSRQLSGDELECSWTTSRCRSPNRHSKVLKAPSRIVDGDDPRGDRRGAGAQGSAATRNGDGVREWARS